MTDTTTGPNASPRKRALLRPAMWTAGVVIVIGAIGFFAVPPVAKHYTVKILGETLGRPVSVEGVALNPFTATAEVRGLKILSADAGTEAFAFDALRANVEVIESLVQRGVVLHEVALSGPCVEIGIDENGRHSWSDVAERIASMAEAKDEDPAADESGALFSIGNIRISGGHIRVDDKPRGLQHEVADLEVGVPFISNLPVKVDVFVEPSLSATLDGNPLHMKARLKPFADLNETILDVVLDKFDVTPWLAYAPFEPAFRLPSALLSSNIELSFKQAAEGAPELALRGPLKLEAFQLQDKEGVPVASVPEFELEFADVQPLINRWHFTRLRLAQPEIDLVRLADGGLNLMKLVPVVAEEAAAPKTAATGKDAAAKKDAAAADTVPPDAAAAAAAKGAAPDFLLAHARIRDGVLRFEDRSLAQPFKARIDAINLDLRDLATDSDMPAEIRLDYVTDAGEKLVHEDRLRLEPFEFDGLLNFEAIDAPRYGPYLAQALPGGELRGGKLSGNLRYRIVLDDKGEPRIDLSADALAVRDFALALKGAKDAAVKVPELDVREAVIDLGAQNVKLAALGIKGASVSAVRLKNGEIDLLGLTGPAAKGAKPEGQARNAKSAGKQAEAPWTVAVGKLALQAASVRVEDRTVGKPVVLAVDNIGLEVDGFSTAKGVLSQLKLDSRINRNGRLGVSGSFGLEPLKADLKLDVRSVDLLPIQPYVLEQTKIAISRGNVSTQGRLKLDSGRKGDLLANFRGDVSVGNFASVDRLNATDFLRWRTLRVGGINVHTEPFSLAVQRITLDDFYTRLILDEQGRLNLREIQGGGEQAGGDASAASQQASQSAALDPFIDQTLTNSGPREVEGQRSAELPEPSAPPPPIRIDRIEVKRGNIAFSDRFIRPNYDVNLTDMAGELTGLSTDPDTLATLDLTGRVDKAAPVKVAGELNPFRHDAHLDILASVKDFELTGLSSYAGKYVGYGIAKGKLSAELNYKIEERKLSATNQIFLDQLTFGDKVDSPDAVNLPVQLAVSLLQNSRGEIDLHLPVSGTLDDPQFSVFGLVVKVLFNLIGKAVTSPFSLLGSVLGGGEELSHLELAPGVAAPGEAQREKLGTLATALVDRPALKLDVTGRADPAVDVDGLKQAALQRMVKAQKLKALVAKGEQAPSLDDIELGEAEYPELLKKAYREGDFKKPRNLIGMTKDVPVADMEALILANTEVGDNELRALAQQRAQAVRDWLAGEGGVPGERIFVLEPKVEAVGDEGQVTFSLR
ncbi:DUF748 domain-containing protein [Thauera linaloolentis]|uniref:DUF748 domain-containing protein n=1 Tax=Thauera linaloolentis (strain DSM 12138 / JCM 21573 / CCUG 41526 / CIP 105981 / IAM 15112 / NBRC 102519 / 47Lol) TaxID=1123367 RepID=N6ZCQ0_THAL4|nr:DUF748 domain-containing protein [Thauera linaloolentis]ENO89939.1 hypothetical protein C666_03600 [Thauera linaloolentis 47Lol = DSM 12138]MCM8566634.1 DUF748 domain-containing protein [Thauera linaloolentis]